MHLGMTGRFTRRRAGGQASRARRVPPRARRGTAAHDHVVFHLSNGARVIYNDSAPLRLHGSRAARPSSTSIRCSRARASSRSATRSTARCSPTLFAGKSAPLKAALLDQRLIAGLGNIYVCEALHRAAPLAAPGRRHAGAQGRPADARRPARSPRHPRGARGGDRGGRLVAARPPQTDGSLGYFQHRFRVYDREGEPCPTPRLRRHVARIVQSGRSTFYCPVCQR